MSEEAQCSHLTGGLADCTLGLEKAEQWWKGDVDRATDTDCLPSMFRQEEQCTTTNLAMAMANIQTV